MNDNDWTKEQISAFKKDAREYLDKFEVTSIRENAIDAQVPFGGRYIVYKSIPIVHCGPGQVEITMIAPWISSWILTPGSYFHPDYFAEHWGTRSRGKSLINYNGGEVYASIKAISLITGVTYPDPEELF